ncbi:hypothetical protein HK098_005606 [Nowakowskiella sp. JEL0407]|nr:hypothetical protein HK098_005606 [Nowakowskiella sp. JEL0407]
MKAKEKKYWGNLLDRSTINNTIVTNILKTEFGQITAENSMTWEATEPSKGIFSFSLADPIVNFAKSNGKLLRGHALVWHAQLPAWMTVINNRTILTNAVETHITTVMSRWKGDIYAWDVCNEILNEDGTLRNSPFSKYIGENFVSIAFTAARKADPNAKLYINDYNLDSVSSAKVLSIVNLVKNWRLAGVSIDGIGSSTHLSAGLGAGVQAALTYLATAGVEVAITELDIANAGPTDYSNVVKACLAVSQCVGITSWGVRDSDSFAFNNGLMYDANGNKKPAYDAALAALS